MKDDRNGGLWDGDGMKFDVLKAMFESMGVEVVDITPHPYDEDRARMADMSDEAVKRLWDAYDGVNAPLGLSGEAIHFELNARGCGTYCAV